MSAFNTSGLRLDQGPPLWIPLTFFFTACAALLAAGLIIVVSGGEGLGSVWSGLNAAVVHLGTVGLLLFTMLGALYQMLPVVAGAVVPRPKLAYAVHALLVAGTVALVTAQWTNRTLAFALATAFILCAVALFIVPAAQALLRSTVSTPAVKGMRVAFAGLLAVVLAGLWLAFVRASGGFPDAWVTLRFAHAHLGLIGWVGALITAISWQVVPMFYLAAEVPKWAPVAVRAGVGITIAGLAVAFVARLPFWAIPYLAFPGAAAVWLLQPWVQFVALRRRRRKRADASLLFWWLSLGSAPACFVLGAATALTDKTAVLYGFVVLWGWAASLVHGMLTRIVPFLVWFHRCAPMLGKAPVPSTRELYPDSAAALGFLLHASTLVFGVAAIVTGNPWLWRVLGAGVAVTAAHLAVRLWKAVAGTTLASLR